MSKQTRRQALRNLPSVNALLAHDDLHPYENQYGHDFVVDIVREVLDEVRRRILDDETSTAPTEATLHETVLRRIDSLISPTLEPVINATGVIVHTNLGRALLSERARAAMQTMASSYNNLEYSLAEGGRKSRYRHAEALLCQLTGAEAAVVVNNNAAALVLCLALLAQNREVLISRSQLVEIGGGFRIPDIMTQSGAILREVGTTNRTYPRDYEAACNEATGLILRVHQSNFKMIGFTTEPTLAELVEVGQRHDVPVMDDLGSGTLLDTTPFGLAREPTIQDSVSAGVDVITASGDKLLGGPQAGLILGKKAIIQRLKKHPLIRALRVDKSTLAALQATLLAYLEGTALEEIPVWQMISLPLAEISQRAETWRERVSAAGVKASVGEAFSTVGGGSLPGQRLKTQALMLHVNSPSTLAATLRTNTPRVVARVENEAVLLDPRTVHPEQDEALLNAVLSACGANH